MTYADLIKELSARLNQSQKEVRRLLKHSFEALKKTVDDHHSVTIPDLGTLRVKIRKERKSFNPAHKKFMLLPRKRVITFKPGSAFEDQLKFRRVEHEE